MSTDILASCARSRQAGAATTSAANGNSSYHALAIIGPKPDHAGFHHAECTRRARRHIDDPAPDEWPAIIDAALYGIAGARHGDDASKRPGAMSTRHPAPRAVSAIVGGKTAFSLGRLGDGEQGNGKEGGSMHDKNLAAAPSGPCKAIAAKTRARTHKSSLIGAAFSMSALPRKQTPIGGMACPLCATSGNVSANRPHVPTTRPAIPLNARCDASLPSVLLLDHAPQLRQGWPRAVPRSRACAVHP